MRKSWVTTLGLIAIAVVGIVLRTADLPDRILPDGTVILAGFDPYYHLIRIAETIRQWPWVPLSDPALNHPHGAAIIWPPLFDGSMAAAALLAGCGDDRNCIALATSWLIPLLGVVCMFPLYALARISFGGAVAGAAALLLVLSPVHAWYSRFAFVDHHTAATLLSVVLVLVAARAVRDGAGVASATGLGLVAAAGLLTWNGFLSFVAVVDAYLLLLVILTWRAGSLQLPRLIVVSHGVALLIVTPVAQRTIAAGAQPFSALALSWFHVTAVAAFALVGLVAYTLRTPSFQRLGGGQRYLALAAIIAIPLALLATQYQSITDALGWFSTSDPFMASVDESLPLLSDRGQLNWWAPLRALTFLFYLMPLGLVALAAEIWRAPALDRSKLLVLVWATALFAMALMQRRFAEPLAPAQAVIIAWLLVTAVRRAPRGRLVVAVVATLVVAAAHVAPIAAIAAGDPALVVEMANSEFFTRAKQRMDAAGGILSQWSLGHRAHYTTGRPVVTNNFGSHIGIDSYMDGHRFFMASEEDEAVALLERRRVRYVVVDYNPASVQHAVAAVGRDPATHFRFVPSERGLSFQLLPAMMRTLFFRLVVLEGAQRTFGDPDSEQIEIAGLGRFRLVADSVRDGSRGHPKMFELVRGAALKIHTSPAALVALQYQFTSDSGRPHLYERRVQANETGVATLTVPYPTDRADRGWTSPYEVTVRDSICQLSVPETKVIEGDVVELRCRASELPTSS